MVRNMAPILAWPRLAVSSMQGPVDLFGQFARDAFDLAMSSTLGGRHAAHAAEALQQAGALLGADAGDLFQLAAARPAPWPGAPACR